MLPQEHMKMGAHILAAIFGGPGIFYIWLSFQQPDQALTGIFYLALAVGLMLCAGPSTVDVPRAFARCRALIARWRRR